MEGEEENIIDSNGAYVTHGSWEYPSCSSDRLLIVEMRNIIDELLKELDNA